MQRSGPVIWYIYPPIGGPGLGRYWRGYHLARAWQRYGAHPVVIGPGYHHYFLKPEPLSGTHEWHGVKYHFIPTKRYGNQAIHRLKAIATFTIGLTTDHGLTELARARSPDVIVYSSPYPFGYVAARSLARRYRAALIFEVRDLWPLSLVEILGMPGWHPFVLAAGACERLAYATADRVVSLLPEAAGHMMKRGLDAGKFVYIPNGVDLGQGVPAGGFAATALVERARSLRESGKFVIVHAGNMSVTTNLSLLLQAARLLQEEGRTDVVALLVGRGAREDALRAEARQLRLANVEFFPQVDQPDVAALLQSADAGFAALPPCPIYRFGVSLNKLFEYMSAGLPVIFACDSPNTIVEKAGGGIRVPAADPSALAAALSGLADLPRCERTRMGARGRAFVAAEHDYRTLGQRYMRLFAELRPHAFADWQNATTCQAHSNCASDAAGQLAAHLADLGCGNGIRP
jgi:glycosyltransferase involved in cell wall biosynthesis